MNEKRIEQIVNDLKLANKEVIVDDAFFLFNDNQITSEELVYVLNKLGYQLPDYFESLPLNKQRLFHSHTLTTITIDLKTKQVEEKITNTFNPIYFYELVDLAKKNKRITDILIRYIGSLDNMPLYYLAMQNIKIKNITYATQHSLWMELIDTFKIKTLYEFLLTITRLPNIDKKKQLIESFKKFCLTKGFKLNLDLDFPNFAFNIEMLLADLKPKIANTIKYKFLVLDKKWLKDNEYNQTLENGRTLINKYYKQFDEKKILKLKGLYENSNILESFNANGYLAIYYSLIAMEV